MVGTMSALAVTVFCFFAAPARGALLRASPQQGTPALLTNRSMLVPHALFSASSVQAPALVADSPMMFVAVLTTRATPVAKRGAIRGLWQEVDGGKGHICARFVVCKAADQHQKDLEAEHVAYGDLLFLDCQEGYAQGVLTKKVIAALRAFRLAPGKDACLDRPLFMKMDGDTFARLKTPHQSTTFGQIDVEYTMNSLALSSADFMFMPIQYAGLEWPAQVPDIHPSRPRYEPPSTGPGINYPPAMYGGPGYILGRGLVTRIIDETIADTNVLFNEDRAVGVWVNAIEQRGAKVNWIRIPGTNGFSWDHPVKSGPWGMYPYTLHHHLSKACIQCLTMVDQSNNGNYLLDSCFAQEPLPGL